MVWTTYDLSDITETLVGLLNTAATNSPLWTTNGGTIPYFMINITGSAPETMRDSQVGDCQLNLYLMHVGQSPFLRNTPVFGNNALRNTQQPLALDLAYLLTAYAGDNAVREQQAMSIALRCFHEQPIYVNGNEYLTIGLGADTLDEMSRLWQSFTAAYRLSTVFRVSVGLLTPSRQPDTPAPPPKQMDLTVAPAAAPLDVTPQLFQRGRPVAFGVPSGSTDPAQVGETTGPLAAVAGAQLVVGGEGLAGSQATEIFLSTLDGATTWTITGWRIGTPIASELMLQLPNAYAIGPAPPVPASTPPPGAYLLAVGSTVPPFRSGAIPFAIAPRFDGVTDPPQLPQIGGTYTIHGAGFVPTATQVYLGSTPVPAAQVAVAADGTSVAFTLPAGQPAGLVTVRVRVEGVDAPPAWQLVAP